MNTSRIGRRVAGRTLIELLVAIALGLLILLGVGSLYLASNQSTRSATNLASADNVGQVALTLIGSSVRRAGYAELIGTEYLGLANNTLYQGPTIRGCSGARFTNSDDPNSACGPTVAGAPDSIALWYQADNALASSQGPTDNCVGNQPALQNVTYANYVPRVAQIRVAQNNFFINGNSLSCNGNGTTQPLLNGIEDLKVWYGFDDFAYQNPGVPDIVPAARSLRTASYISGLAAPSPLFSPWDYVVSVTVCVLVRTEEVGTSAQGASVTYTQCPQSANQAAGIDALPTQTATDGRARRTFTQTFAVRVRGRPNPLAS